MKEYEIIPMEFDELDIEFDCGRPNHIREESEAINILLIDDKDPHKGKGDYGSLWQDFKENDVFRNLAPINLFWIQSVHAACLKLIENDSRILPGVNFSPINSIVFLDMTFIETNEHGSLLSKLPKLKKYLDNKKIDVNEATEGGEILLKIMEKEGLYDFSIIPWTSDPNSKGTRALFAQFENKLKKLSKRHPDKNAPSTAWEIDKPNYLLLKEKIELLRTAVRRPPSHPFGNFTLNNIPQEIIAPAYDKLFTGDFHNPKDLFKKPINGWKLIFLDFLQTEITIGENTGRWSQIGDKELQKVFGKIKDEIAKDEPGIDLRAGIVKLKYMLQRNENRKTSLLDLFESLVDGSEEEVDFCLDYCGQSFFKHRIKTELESHGYSPTLWSEMANNRCEAAILLKDFNFYDIREALKHKIRENISGLHVEKVEVNLYFKTFGGAAGAYECRIVIKDNMGKPYLKDISDPHPGQEAKFLNFIKEKLDAKTINVVIIRDVLSIPPVGCEEIVKSMRKLLINQSYILTVEGLYTEVFLKII